MVRMLCNARSGPGTLIVAQKKRGKAGSAPIPGITNSGSGL